MTGLIVRADAGGFIWLIVGVFWVIAQIAGAAAKKNQPTRPVANGNEPDTTSGDPFAELMRKMAGIQTFEVPQPEYKELPEEPVFAEENPWQPGEIEKLPDIEPLRRETMGQAETIPASAEIPGIDIRPKMSAFRNSIPSIKLPAMNLSFHGSETSARNVPALGKIIDPSDKRSLRRAMISHIIFSPPKAME
jgi:hypothetical protein